MLANLPLPYQYEARRDCLHHFPRHKPDLHDPRLATRGATQLLWLGASDFVLTVEIAGLVTASS